MTYFFVFYKKKLYLLILCVYSTGNTDDKEQKQNAI